MGIQHHIILSAVLALCASAAQALDVPVITAKRTLSGTGFELDGSIQPVRQATVAAQIGGNILQLAVKAGDKVKAGQLLVRIDERETLAGVQKGDAALAQAQAEANNAKASLDRTRELRAKGFVSQAALDQAETQAKSAQAAVSQAQGGLKQAALARGFSSVTAPFDGIVLATHVDLGDLATPGRPIATLYAPNNLRAVVQVGLSRADMARKAQNVEVTLPDGQRVIPVRKTELASADPVSQTIEWRLDLPADVQNVAVPGQVIRVRFDSPGQKGPGNADSGTLRLPSSAVLRRGEISAVYIAQGDQFVLRVVRLGADRGEAGIEILAGLNLRIAWPPRL